MSSENIAALIQALSLGSSAESERISHKKGKRHEPTRTLESKPQGNRWEKKRSKEPPNGANDPPLAKAQTKSREERVLSHQKLSQQPKNTPLSTSVHEPSCPNLPSQQDIARRGLPPNTPTGPKKRQPNSASKNASPSSSTRPPEHPRLFIVQYEAQYSTTANYDILFGVFTSLAAATQCVEIHYPNTQGRPGIQEAIEYSVQGGRVMVLPKVFHIGGNGEVVRDYRKEEGEKNCVEDTGRMSKMVSNLDEVSAVQGEGVVEGIVYLAVDRRGSGGLFCVGAFTEKHEAWKACLKYKSQLAYCSAVKDETRWVDELGMPHVRGKIEGSGDHIWFVKMYKLDEMVSVLGT